jgi:hypothetical protein
MRRHLPSPRRHLLRTTLVVGTVVVAGCGTTDRDYQNTDRPAAAIVVSASIGDNEVSVSPKRLGAGPITLIITNQSGSSQQVTLETTDEPGSGPGVTAVKTGPINPRETASVKAEVEPGSYDLSVRGSDVRAARITVGKRRASSQNELLQP